MIIGIDGNEANVPQKVGVNEYAFQIIWNLWKLQEKGECKDNLIVYLKNKPLPDLPKQTQKFRYKIINGGPLWILTRLMPNLFFGEPRPDIFFSPSHYTPPFAPMPRICSIMDLGYLKFSGQFKKIDFWQLTIWSAISIYVSKAVIAISNSTKDDIVRHYPFAKEKVYVTHLGYDSERFNQDFPEKDVRHIKNKYAIVDDYILYIGTLKPSKNIEGLIEAFARINRKRSLTSLIIAGKKGWLYKSIYKKVEKLDISDRVVFTDYVSQEEKVPLIKGARVFVIPSFWEGFGLDAISAMASGVPVVAANVGSLPEVVGNAGVLINPNSIDSIEEGLMEVLTADKKKYNGMVTAGLLQAKDFSWEKCTRETLKIITDAKG